MTAQTAADLRAAADLIEPEGAWCRTAVALLLDGDSTFATDPSACRWCLFGAIKRVTSVPDGWTDFLREGAAMEAADAYAVSRSAVTRPHAATRSSSVTLTSAVMCCGMRLPARPQKIARSRLSSDVASLTSSATGLIAASAPSMAVIMLTVDLFGMPLRPLLRARVARADALVKAVGDPVTVRSQ